MITIKDIADRRLMPVAAIKDVHNTHIDQPTAEQRCGWLEFYVDEGRVIVAFRPRFRAHVGVATLVKLSGGMPEVGGRIDMTEAQQAEFREVIARITRTAYVHIVYRRVEFEDRSVEGVYRVLAEAMAHRDGLKLEEYMEEGWVGSEVLK